MQSGYCPIDWDLFMEINGSGEAGRMVIDAFLEESPIIMGKIVEAVRNRKPMETRMWAHKLKGSTLFVAANRLARNAHCLERVAEKGNIAMIEKVMKHVYDDYRSLLEYLLNETDYKMTTV